jgi:hypothetical protein
MAMVRAAFLIIILSVAQLAWSNDFRDGYVILNSNDTLRGLVEAGVGSDAFKSCQFKLSKTDELRIYHPEDIKGYGIYMGRVYSSRKIQGKDQKFEKAFLRLIVSSLVSLYEFENEFYVEKGEVSPYRLSNEETEFFAGGQRSLKKTNKHIAILNMLMSDKPQLKNAIREISLNEKALIKLVEDYNNLNGAAMINYNEDKPRVPLDASNALTRETKDGFNHYESLWNKQRTYGQYEPVISVSQSSPAPNGEFSFLGGAVSASPAYPVYTLSNPSFPSSGGYLILGSKQLNGRFGNYYSSTDFGLSPYINLGFSGNHEPDAFTPAEPGGVSSQHAAFARDPFLTGTNQFGYWGGLGVSKPFTSLNTYFELRYEQLGMTPMSQMGYRSGFQSNVTNVQFVVGFRRK